MGHAFAGVATAIFLMGSQGYAELSAVEAAFTARFITSGRLLEHKN